MRCSARLAATALLCPVLVWPILVCSVVVWPVSAAEAHAILVESTPSSNATAPAGKLHLQLRYNSRIDAARSRLTLIASDGATTILPIEPEQRPDELAARIDLPPGSWRLRWQVLAVDGHITRGDVPFTLTAP